MKEFQIVFYPIGKKVTLNTSTTILDAARSIGLNLSGPCGGQGKCGKCAVRIIRYPHDIFIPPDQVSKKVLTETQIKKGYRLACTFRVNDFFGIELPSWVYEPDGYFNFDESSGSGLTKGWLHPRTDDKFDFDPIIKSFECSLPKPSIDDNISDLERLAKYLETNLHLTTQTCEFINMKISNFLLKSLSAKFRSSNWNFKIILSLMPNQTQLLGLKPIKKTVNPDQGGSDGIYGIALDIGTSTLVAYLIDLATGTELSGASCVNPQVRIGADVITRIRYSSQSKKEDLQLTNILIEAINKLIAKVCSDAGIEQESVYELVAIGNTAMLHNLVGVPLSNLGSAPYTPAMDGDCYSNTSEINLNTNKCGKLYLGPLVSGFFGADGVGTALVTGMGLELSDKEDSTANKNILALDIGTNGEILLSGNSRILACSAAAGPAFEGSNLRFGMRALPGAVYKVSIENRNIRTKVIGRIRPIGITGSGVVDAISEFLKAGAISRNGSVNPHVDKKWLRLQKDKNLRGVTEPTDNCDLVLPELLIVPKRNSDLNTSITITQDDIREVQLAKAAIRSGIDILLWNLGLTVDDLDEVYLAGAFGNYLDPKSAMGIRLLPEISVEKIKSIGNSAGTSAKLLLRSGKAREIAKQLAGKIEYIDLATQTDFQDIFIENMGF
jgi:uncharacterized 2Fe-2S/4Fe-4S cluster protein (DUF4445 family)